MNEATEVMSDPWLEGFTKGAAEAGIEHPEDVAQLIKASARKEMLDERSEYLEGYNEEMTKAAGLFSSLGRFLGRTRVLSPAPAAVAGAGVAPAAAATASPALLPAMGGELKGIGKWLGGTRPGTALLGALGLGVGTSPFWGPEVKERTVGKYWGVGPEQRQIFEIADQIRPDMSPEEQAAFINSMLGTERGAYDRLGRLLAAARSTTTTDRGSPLPYHYGYGFIPPRY
jgi:hypothetical protein